MGARFDDAVAGSALVFPDPARVLQTRDLAEVGGLLVEVERATSAGVWAYGFLAYEAGAGLDPALPAGRTEPGEPLAWFALGGPPRVEPLIAAVSGRRGYWCSEWVLDAGPGSHRRAVVRIQDRIAAGEIYQANLTGRARARVRGDLHALYADLVHAQHAAHNAYLEVGGRAVLSVSPELFLDWSGPRLVCRLMKGTAARHVDPGADARAARDLAASVKDVAENVMITDLVRNDLGRIAQLGTVRVRTLCACEPFGGVWQLSSQVEAEPRPDAGLLDVLTALFPSGSITGAPKRAAMRVIRELEPELRGVYCGAIGWLAPPGEPTRARFSVAIRTLVLDRRTGAAYYGTGGGITTGSDPGAEYREMLAKLAVLDAAREDDLELIETLRFERRGGFGHLDAHLTRLARSAAYFGIPCDRQRVAAALHAAVQQHAAAKARVRVRLHADGEPRVDIDAYPTAPPGPVRLAIDTQPVDPHCLWLRHKTNRREIYHAARTRHPDADDVILTNQHGHLTETTIASIAVRLDGRWWTPPLTAGCLPGIGRAIALADGRLSERDLTIDDLHRSDGIAVINSLRGWRQATLPNSRFA